MKIMKCLFFFFHVVWENSTVCWKRCLVVCWKKKDHLLFHFSDSSAVCHQVLFRFPEQPLKRQNKNALCNLRSFFMRRLLLSLIHLTSQSSHTLVYGSSDSFPFLWSFGMPGFFQSRCTDCCMHFPSSTSASCRNHCIMELMEYWLSLFFFCLLSVSVCWQDTMAQSSPMDRLAVERPSPSRAALSTTVTEESFPELCPISTSISTMLVTISTLLYIFFHTLMNVFLNSRCFMYNQSVENGVWI